MTEFTITIAQLDKLLYYLIDKRAIDESELQALAVDCENWLIQVESINYFLGRIIEYRIKANKLTQTFVDDYYHLSTSGGYGFTISELDRDFIDYCLQFTNDMNLDLEGTLILMHERKANRYFK